MTEKFAIKHVKEMRQNRIELLKDRYPIGCRVRCDFMNDRYAVPSGTEGTVQYIDDMGTIHVRWDNGSSLGLIYGEDEFTRIE